MTKKTPQSSDPLGRLITVSEAAYFLNVSRPYMVQLLEDQKIKCAHVGTRQRVVEEDLIKYKLKMRWEQENALEELITQAQVSGMGYRS
jgi:excisionase family DNA binding protein